MEEQPWRELTNFERELLEKLLDAPGYRAEERGVLRQQLNDCRVRTVDEDGCIDFQTEGAAHYPVVEG